MKNQLRQISFIAVFICSITACLDEDVSTVYFYKNKFVCEGVVTDSFAGLAPCFDKKRYNSVVVKVQSGTNEKIIVRLMDEAGKNNMDRVRLEPFIKDDVEMLKAMFGE